MRILFRLFIAAVISIFLINCGGSSSGSQPVMKATLISPVDGESNVSRSPSITFGFNVPASGVNSTSVELINTNTQESVAITTIIAGANNTYYFTPADQLDEEVTYKIMLNSGIKDGSGNSLESTSFSFTTGDFTNPTVSMVNATNISTSSIITLSFSEAVNNVTTSNVIVSKNPSGTAPIPTASITGSQYTNNSYTITMAAPLEQSTRYYVILTNGITDFSGNSLARSSFNFTTGDFKNPTVSLTSPTPNSSNAIGFPAISLTFSEAVNGVNTTSVSLRKDGIYGQIVGVSQPVLSGTSVYTFSPTTKLDANTTYYVSVTSQITDKSPSNNPLLPAVFAFSTGNDVESPTVTMTSPADNQSAVSVTPTITLQFSENMNTTTVINSNVILKTAAVASVAIGPISNSNGDTVFTFSPAAKLSEQTGYVVELTSAVKDDAGNSVVPASFTFTTGGFTYPVASLNSPLNNASNIALDSTITVGFSETVKNVTPSTLYLSYKNGAIDVPVPGAVASVPFSNNWTITPSSPLFPAIFYTVNVVGKASGITDNAAIPNPVGNSTNNIDGAKFYFSTVAE